MIYFTYFLRCFFGRLHIMIHIHCFSSLPVINITHLHHPVLPLRHYPLHQVPFHCISPRPFTSNKLIV
nr:MAG TPA: hypothetical protein [Caudoviricetes sp.]